MAGGYAAVAPDYTTIQGNVESAHAARLKNQQDAWANNLTRLAADAYSKNLKPDGSLDEMGYYSAAAQAGLPPELAGAYRAHTLAQAKTQTGLSQERMAQRVAGYEPDAAQPSYPQPSQQSAAPRAPSVPSSFADLAAGVAGVQQTGSKAPAKTISESSAAPTTPSGGGNEVRVLGTTPGPSAGEEGKLSAGDVFDSASAPPPRFGQIQGFVATDKGFNPLQMLQSAGFTPRTARDVATMSKEDQIETAAGLRAKGIPVPANFDAATLANGMNTYAAARVRANMGSFNPFDMGETMKAAMGVATGGEATANESIGDLAKGARETKTTRLGQTSAAQGIKSTGQELAAVDDARKQGFGNVTRTNIGNFKETKSAVEWLQSTKGHTDELLAQAKAGRPLDADAFGTILIGLTQAPKNAEGIGTEAGQADFMATLRREKSLGQVVGEARGVKDLAELAAKNAIAPQEQAVILRNLSNLLGVQLKTGKAVNELKQYRTAGQNAKDAVDERARALAGKGKAWTTKPDATAKTGDTYKGYTLGADGKWR